MKACKNCSGIGSLKSETCSGCNGQGMKVSIKQMGFMVQQSVGPCSDCNGQGKKIIQSCAECNGQKYKNSDKILKSQIKPGFPNGHKIRFKEEGSESSDYERAGDIILNLVCAKNNIFEWKGNDLHINYSVTIAEALLGFNMLVKDHPSGKNINLSWDGGSLQHDTILIAKNLGMPILDSSKYGNLFIHIKIINNKVKWTPEQRQALKTIFPEWNEITPNGDALEFS